MSKNRLKIYCSKCHVPERRFKVDASITPQDLETEFKNDMIYCYNCGEDLEICDGKAMCIEGCGLVNIEG